MRLLAVFGVVVPMTVIPFHAEAEVVMLALICVLAATLRRARPLSV